MTKSIKNRLENLEQAASDGPIKVFHLNPNYGPIDPKIEKKMKEWEMQNPTGIAFAVIYDRNWKKRKGRI